MSARVREQIAGYASAFDGDAMAHDVTLGLAETPGQLWGRLAELNERKHSSEWVARHDYDGEVCRRAVRQHDCGRNHTYRRSDADDEQRLQRRDAASILWGLTSIDDE